MILHNYNHIISKRSVAVLNAVDGGPIKHFISATQKESGPEKGHRPNHEERVRSQDLSQQVNGNSASVPLRGGIVSNATRITQLSRGRR